MNEGNTQTPIMTNKKIKWLIYTVMVGLLPFILRFVIFLVSQDKENLVWINPSDIVAFGLILHISNINELEHINSSDPSWKTIQNGVSIAFISLYSVFFAISLIHDSRPDLFEINYVVGGLV